MKLRREPNVVSKATTAASRGLRIALLTYTECLLATKYHAGLMILISLVELLPEILGVNVLSYCTGLRSFAKCSSARAVNEPPRLSASESRV